MVKLLSVSGGADKSLPSGFLRLFAKFSFSRKVYNKAGFIFPLQERESPKIRVIHSTLSSRMNLSVCKEKRGCC